MYFYWLDLLAVIWFFSCWIGYSYYSIWRSQHVPCLASIMHAHRKEWAMQIVNRDARIADVSALATLEHTATFFASSTLIIIAALATALGAVDQGTELLTVLPFKNEVSLFELEVILVSLIGIYIYAFFKISWSIRQYGFVAVMIGALPSNNVEISHKEKLKLAAPLAKTTSAAAMHFNNGLRSYYFSLAVFAWFIGPIALMAASALVVNELHRREFRSRVLKNILSVTEQ